MVAIAEYQVRSSPKWQPPLRHEVGGWQVEDPPFVELGCWSESARYYSDLVDVGNQ